MKKVYVLLEVTIKEGRMDEYLQTAAAIKEELAQTEGFISSERFRSLATDNKLLSMSVWENEEAVTKWRNAMNHRMAQAKARDELFESYQISVTTLDRVYTKAERDEAPGDSNEYFGV